MYEKLINKYCYHDKATVWRAVARSGWDKVAWERVYKEIPCHLAQAGKEMAAHNDDRAEHLTENLRLDCDNCYEILPGDEIETRQLKFTAGESFRYLTHQEITVFRRKEANER